MRSKKREIKSWCGFVEIVYIAHPWSHLDLYGLIGCRPYLRLQNTFKLHVHCVVCEKYTPWAMFSPHRLSKCVYD